MITRWRGTASPYNKLRFFFLALRYAQRLLCDAGSGVRRELPKIWRIMGSKHEDSARSSTEIQQVA